ncbi:MAG TPA: AMP-binding protein [Acidimicrobiales bacterium]|jgi:fatty-acyl-CoA synthase|nr:AMP-binding protein [Acidimicrobiales bacterium]
MPGAEWSIPAVLDVVTGVAPDRDMLVRGPARRTYAEVQDRTRRLAGFLQARGVSTTARLDGLDRWECGQPKVALVLANCPEYVEAMIGAYRARAVPFNVNHHYQPHELAALLRQIGTDAVVYHPRLGPLLAGADLDGRLRIHVDDGSGTEPLPGSVPFEDAIAAGSVAGLPEPSPDDRYLVCTGGTTGKPKGVLWRQADVYIGAMSGVEDATEERIAAIAGRGAGVWFASPPLMHAAAQWTVFSSLHMGGTVVLHDDTATFDPAAILAAAERERVTLLTIVGDAYGRPLVEELRRHRYDLSALRVLATGGAFTSAEVKHELLELLPHVTINDGYGASETGGMAFGASRKGDETRRFDLAAGARILSDDRTHFLEPGDDSVGWTARSGRVPIGYLDDQAATERTFPIIDGQRVAVPGDRARYDADGRMTVLGRDSMVVNTGGEKVFVEEVEQAICRHPDVADALVVGRPSERFGQEVVALVQARPGATVTPADIRAFAATQAARFKAPRAVLLCQHIRRHPSGKADYTWARAAALDAVDATG